MNDEIICECGHAVTEHTYSTDFSGCDRKDCNCTRLVPEIVANTFRARVEAAEKAISSIDKWREYLKTIPDAKFPASWVASKLLELIAAALAAKGAG